MRLALWLYRYDLGSRMTVPANPQPEGPVPSSAATPPAGWYLVDPYSERWWNGSGWTEHLRPALVQQQPGQVPPQTVILNGPPLHGRMVTTVPVRTSHTFHLLMTVFTCGLWGVVWLAMILINKLSRDRHITHY